MAETSLEAMVLVEKVSTVIHLMMKRLHCLTQNQVNVGLILSSELYRMCFRFIRYVHKYSNYYSALRSYVFIIRLSSGTSTQNKLEVVVVASALDDV